MTEQEIINTISSLAKSQGSWGRFKDSVMTLKKQNRYQYKKFIKIIQDNCKDVVDMVMFLES